MTLQLPLPSNHFIPVAKGALTAVPTVTKSSARLKRRRWRCAVRLGLLQTVAWLVCDLDAGAGGDASPLPPPFPTYEAPPLSPPPYSPRPADCAQYLCHAREATYVLNCVTTRPPCLPATAAAPESPPLASPPPGRRYGRRRCLGRQLRSCRNQNVPEYQN
ncbi:unnamed protein product [Phaeothamnion confervicola]